MISSVRSRVRSRAWMAPGLALALLASTAFAPRPASSQSIRTGGHTQWTDMKQADCVSRALEVISLAGSRYSIPRRPGVFDGWLVRNQAGEITVALACIADSESGKFADQSAERILVDIDVHSLRGDEGPVRDFVRDCFFFGRCGDQGAGPGNAGGGGPGTGGGDGGRPAGLPGGTGCWKGPFEDQGIRGQNVETVKGVTLPACADLCMHHPRHARWCRSFEYDGAGRTCYLQDVRAGDRGLQLVAAGGIDHYERGAAS